MRKFKLIKTYPGSPELGTEVFLFYGDGYNTKNNFFVYRQPIHIIEDYPEFWEEVIDKPLFTTEDGVDIYEGDRIYCIFSDFSIGFTGKLNFKPTTLCFSSKERAEEYILMNKPCLSINDVNNCYDSPHGSPIHNKLVDKLKQLVKSKL